MINVKIVINLVNKHHFEFLHVVGKGGFGKVIELTLFIKRSGKFYSKKTKHHLHLRKCQK